MKVLIIDNGWVLQSGKELLLEPRVRDFLRSCSRHFDATAYLCSSPVSASEGFRGVPLDHDLVRIIPVPARGRRRWARLLSYLCHLGVIAKTVRESDFLYVFYPGNVPLLGVAMARLARKPYGIYLRGELGKRSPWWRWTIAGAKFAITAGSVLADAARAYCDDVEQAVPMCPLPDDPAGPGRPLRTQPPWRLLYVGRLETRKGTRDLLEAMSLLRRRGVDVRLDLVGQDFLGSAPHGAAEPQEYVNFVGVVNDDERLRQYYSEADLFCFPSHDEGFPRVLYEAMAYGVPIVTTFVGSIAGVLEDGVNCLRVDARSPSALADTIARALADPDLRQRLRAGGLVAMRPIRRQWKERGHDKQLAAKIAAHASSDG